MVVFLGGLIGFVFVFFFFCFLMGRVINTQFLKQDGEATKWQREAGTVDTERKRQNLTSNPEMDQKELQKMTAIFPTPRLDVDDGNQATADLHAREDLLLEPLQHGERHAGVGSDSDRPGDGVDRGTWPSGGGGGRTEDDAGWR